MFFVSLMCLWLGLNGFVPFSEGTWQMPLEMAWSLTIGGGIGVLFSWRPRADRIKK